MSSNTQRRLPFDPAKEQQRLDRVGRLRSSKLRGRIKRASELRFNYDQATKAATTRRSR